MDADRFDTITRSLTNTRCRRGALAAALGGLAALFEMAEAGAGMKTGKRKGRKGKGKGNNERRSCSEGRSYRQCGVCVDGRIQPDPLRTDCRHIDPDGCSVCGPKFMCSPGNDGQRCKECGRCGAGLCQNAEDSACPGSNQRCNPMTLLCEDACDGKPGCGLTQDGRQICCLEDEYCCEPATGINRCCKNWAGCVGGSNAWCPEV